MYRNYVHLDTRGLALFGHCDRSIFTARCWLEHGIKNSKLCGSQNSGRTYHQRDIQVPKAIYCPRAIPTYFEGPAGYFSTFLDIGASIVSQKASLVA
jgi:hypothetical protein